MISRSSAFTHPSSFPAFTVTRMKTICICHHPKFISFFAAFFYRQRRSPAFVMEVRGRTFSPPLPLYASVANGVGDDQSVYAKPSFKPATDFKASGTSSLGRAKGTTVASTLIQFPDHEVLGIPLGGELPVDPPIFPNLLIALLVSSPGRLLLICSPARNCK